MKVYPNACHKQTVVAYILTPSGDLVIGWNRCEAPQEYCPRDREAMKSGEGYHLCKQVCQQGGHAEVDAIQNGERIQANLIGGVLFLYGHTYCCDACIQAMKGVGLAAYVVDGDYYNLMQPKLPEVIEDAERTESND